MFAIRPWSVAASDGPATAAAASSTCHSAFAGVMYPAWFSPNVLMMGPMIRYASTPPATMMPAIRGPMMYPTPSSGADMSDASVAPFSPTAFPPTTPDRASPAVSLNSRTPCTANWKTNPMPSPTTSVPAVLPPFSPALSTSAHAVPSGYFSSPCLFTMNARRSGIIIRMPSSPPNTPTVITLMTSMSNPITSRAGITSPTPKAMLSPALPVVWTMLFSSTVRFRWRNALEITRNRPNASTATGMLADTVRPTFSTR